MPRRSNRIVGRLLIAAMVVVVSPGFAEEPIGPNFYSEQVAPLLKTKCGKCHSHEVREPKGSLLLDSLEAMLAGGESGATIVPGKPEESLLIQAVEHADGWKMPPQGEKLPDAEIALLRRWIAAGAPAPENKNAKLVKRRGGITEEDRRWWAFQPIVDPPVPETQNRTWPRNEIDRFVLARLENERLTPAPEAEKRALIRRLTFDLTGLSPTPRETEDFLASDDPAAYEKLVDRLLASSRYGEKWAGHWLDLVRYADSDGYRIDDYRPHAWRYRDYVIASLNNDKPYDRFVREQLAGDELYPDDPAAAVATGYLCHWIYEYNNRDAEGQWQTILNDVTDTTADVFLGLGLQCARCHDHKFDPLLQKDYFRLQAFFAALKPYAESTVATDVERREYAEKLAEWEKVTAAIRGEIAEIEAKYRRNAENDAVGKFPDEVQAMLKKPESERTPYERQISALAYRQVTYEFNRLDGKLKGEDKDRVLALRKKLTEFDRLKPEPLPTAMTATDLGPQAAPIVIPKKGKEPIEPGFPTILQEDPATIVPGSATTGRRSALAAWLTDPANPLTSRVMVNRVWQIHFGRGLAPNLSDFGKLGEAPSHPELLDYLAKKFMREGWSLKRLHREIVTSATYRQSANHPAAQTQRVKDPANVLSWRGETRRLSAEQIRDSLFAASGELKLTTGGPGVNSGDPRRSVYCKIMRNNRDPLLDAFDLPFGFQSAASRDTTTTPVQSLLLINSQFMLKRAEAFAARLEKEASDEQARIALAYRYAYAREPRSEEVNAAQEFLKAQRERIDPGKNSSAQAAFLFEKLPQRDGQAAVISPEGPQRKFEMKRTDKFPQGDFTIEAFVMLRSVYESSSVRVIAAQSTGDSKKPSWAFGVTGLQSRRKPQTLVLQLFGNERDGSFGEEAIFSDHTIQLNKPYYLGAAVKLGTKEAPGTVTFFVKDLSNDDEPLLQAAIPHESIGGFHNDLPLTIGGKMTPGAYFDGLIDDVRLSESALDVNDLLFTNEKTNRFTVGYWQWEAKPDVFRDVSGHGLDLAVPKAGATEKNDVSRAAWRDFTHALLNSNEFLYVD